MHDRTEYQTLFDKLVPYHGPANTVEGELIRAISKIAYRWYNDGDYFFMGYGAEIAGAAASYLRDSQIPGIQRDISAADGQFGEGYTTIIEKIVESVVEYVKSKGDELTPNYGDMLEYDNYWEDRIHEVEMSDSDYDEEDEP